MSAVNCEVVHAFSHNGKMLSPFPEEHLGKMWAWLQQYKTQMVDDFSPQSPDELKAFFSSHKGPSFAFLDGKDKPIGAVWADPLGKDNYMGHLVFERDGLTSVDKLFMTARALKVMFDGGAKKIWWESYIDNRAYLLFLRKLGAVPETSLKSMPTKRDGQSVKSLLFASYPENL
jgi:hypothetical protein